MNSVFSWFSDPKVIAVVAPLLVVIAKRVVSTIPPVALPVLSVVFGILLSAVSGGDVTTAITTGGMAGLAGVGVREIVDQGKKALGK